MKSPLLQIVQEAPSDSISSKADVLKELSALSFNDIIAKVTNQMIDFAIHLTIAIIVFYIGKFIINKIHKFVLAIMIRRQVDKSLSTFILSLIKIVLLFILTVIVIGILGIETSSFLAIFASAGVAIGMALSGTLQNFAGGVLILLLKPYKIGDFIEAQGYSGTVSEIQIFHTIINTPDNKSIIIPNGGLSTGSINNASKETYRRVEWTVSISYGDNVDKAREVILSMLVADERVVKRYIEDDANFKVQENSENGNNHLDIEQKRSFWNRIFPHHSKVKKSLAEWGANERAKTIAMIPRIDRSPSVNVSALADSSVNLVVRAWTRSEFFWGLFFDINEKIYNELPAHGLSFPFPQMDVHLSKHE